MILFHVAISQIYDIIIATKRVVFRHSGSNTSHSLYIDWICCFTCSYREVRVMNITMLKSKIHRAVVTQAELNYVGSITVDSELLSAAGILEYELVQIVDIENGNRFETYTIAGEPGSGVMCLNGAAARQVQVGDHIILMCYASMSPEEAKEHTPKVVFVNDDNSISRITDYEKHGELFS